LQQLNMTLSMNLLPTNAMLYYPPPSTKEVMYGDAPTVVSLSPSTKRKAIIEPLRCEPQERPSKKVKFSCKLDVHYTLPSSISFEEHEAASSLVDLMKLSHNPGLQDEAKEEDAEEEDEDDHEDPFADMWWTEEEMEGLKQRARILSLRLRRHYRTKKSSSCPVELAHKKTFLMIHNKVGEIMKLKGRWYTSPDQDLLQWCAHNDGRRGLERLACQEFSADRMDDIQKTCRAVMEEQDRQREAQVQDPLLIATASKVASRRARTYALFLGEADSKAAQKA